MSGELEREIRLIAEDVYRTHQEELFLQLSTEIQKNSQKISEEEIKEIIEKLMPDLNKVISDLVKKHLEFLIGKLLEIMKTETET